MNDNGAAGVKLENAVSNDFEIDVRIFSAEEILLVAVVMRVIYELM